MSRIVYEVAPKVSISEFLDDLSYEFTDAPYGLLENAVKRAIQRICERSNMLRRTVKIRTECNVHNYLLEPPDCVDVIAVMAIELCCGSHCQREVQRITTPTCKVCCGGYEVFVNGNELVFTNPKMDSLFHVELSVKPTRDSCDVDAILVNEHYELVLDGVRSNLCALPNKPWSSVQRAQLAEQSFLRGCAEAAVDTMMGSQRGAMRIKRSRII